MKLVGCGQTDVNAINSEKSEWKAFESLKKTQKVVRLEILGQMYNRAEDVLEPRLCGKHNRL